MEPTNESPKGFSLKSHFENFSQKLSPEPKDPVELFRQREELRAAHNPNANIDERVEQDIIREIRDGGKTAEEKQKLYNQLSDKARMSTPAPIKEQKEYTNQDFQSDLKIATDAGLNEEITPSEKPIQIVAVDKGNERQTVPVTIVPDKPSFYRRTLNRVSSFFNRPSHSSGELDITRMPYDIRRKEALDWLKEYSTQTGTGLDAEATEYIQTHFGADVLDNSMRGVEEISQVPTKEETRPPLPLNDAA